MLPMKRPFEEIEAELLELDRHTRAALAKALLDSLDAARDDADYDALWLDEAERRYDDFKSGKTTAIDGDEVFARARSRSR